jgi:hypothetical protein
MTYKQFEKTVLDIVSKSDNKHQWEEVGYTCWGWIPVRSWMSDVYKDKKHLLRAEWYVGGYTGGNCWDDTEPHYERSLSTPEELVLLDEILNKLKPDIKFLQYKQLVSSVVKHDSRSQSEYYGNSSDYESISVDLKDLYDYMNKEGWLKE